jgi:hypothetical protein
MSALKGKVLPLHIDTRNGIRLFVDGLIKFLGHRRDFGPAPKLTLMASCTFGFIDH